MIVVIGPLKYIIHFYLIPCFPFTHIITLRICKRESNIPQIIPEFLLHNC